MRVLKIWAASGPFGSALIATSSPASFLPVRSIASGGSAHCASASSSSGRPTPVLTETAEHRNQAAGGDRLADQPRQLLVGRHLALEVPFGYAFVDLDDRFDERLVDRCRIEQGPLGTLGRVERARHPLEIGAVANRQVERHAGTAEQFLNRTQQGRVVDVVGVHLVDDDHSSQAALARLAEHAPRVDADARVRVDHDGRRFHGPHRSQHLADEVGIAGRVDQVEVAAAVIEMDDARLDRVVMGLFLFVEVADARAVVDAGRTFDRAGGVQEGVGERRLAGRSMATEHNVADVLNLRLRHAEFPSKLSVLSTRLSQRVG